MIDAIPRVDNFNDQGGLCAVFVYLCRLGGKEEVKYFGESTDFVCSIVCVRFSQPTTFSREKKTYCRLIKKLTDTKITVSAI